MDKLRQGKAVSRRYRNRRIREFLKELDLTEGRCTGISKIIKAMAANGSPAPEFETDDERSYFLTRLPVHEKAADWSAGPTDSSGEDNQVESARLPNKTTQETTQEKILRILRDRPQSTRIELAAEPGLTPDGVKYHLTKLSKAGLIQHTGPTKAGRWEVLQ